MAQRLTKRVLKKKVLRNALKQHIKMHSKSIMVLTEEEYKIYRELRRRGLKPCFPSHVREITNYKWEISRCQVFLKKVGYKQELGYNLKQLALIHQGNRFVIVRVIE